MVYFPLLSIFYDIQNSDIYMYMLLYYIALMTTLTVHICFIRTPDVRYESIVQKGLKTICQRIF